MEKDLTLEARFKALIQSVPEIMETIEACANYGLPDYYLAGGAAAQALWNNMLGEAPLSKVKDFDVVYFAHEASALEKEHENTLNRLTRHSIPIDVKNQAYVHEWYPRKFGHDIPPYQSAEAGISSWLPAFAIGVRKQVDDLKIFAPFGLNDAMNMVIRPNKTVMSAANYMTLVDSFKRRWPMITTYPWEGFDNA
ncbi:nucleotidyltransferase family protein [Hahella sp. CR1]|uniref:nucleotidyltransferase family protein n=1 Tax=Hahella sp. CR1 TaxID=2992807 RepID=UPI002440FA85|nr:nucleotidyltransferase family protein [Hahella sp. CR1]MDG9671652.1 nucleotidyltransferase family protein [Hahella sp. CR1]